VTWDELPSGWRGLTTERCVFSESNRERDVMSGHCARAAASIGGVVLLIAGHVCLAQGARGETDSARAVRHAAEAASLAKASQNPVANMISLPLQYNFSTAGGLGPNSELVLNVQPVVPLPIGERWLIVSRTVVPFTNVPLTDNTRETGIADIQEQAYFTAAKPGTLTWAVGPIFSFPTATNPLLRTGQWGLGPTAVALVMPGPWVIGVLANNIWRIGGAAHGEVLNSFTVQPFINFNLPRAWAISTAPLITSNWSAPEGERWTVPIGLGVSKITHIGDQPMNLLLQYYHNVKHPDIAGSEQIRLEVVALWPTAAAKAEKEKEMAGKEKAEKEKAAKEKQ
jgi:hypothetical protein